MMNYRHGSTLLKQHLGLQWARYSLFRLKGKPLLVSEGFSARLNEFI